MIGKLGSSWCARCMEAAKRTAASRTPSREALKFAGARESETRRPEIFKFANVCKFGNHKAEPRGSAYPRRMEPPREQPQAGRSAGKRLNAKMFSYLKTGASRADGRALGAWEPPREQPQAGRSGREALKCKSRFP
jgi:hypothetical protein